MTHYTDHGSEDMVSELKVGNILDSQSNEQLGGNMVSVRNDMNMMDTQSD